MIYYVGVGSNIGDRLRHIQKACSLLKEESIKINRSSSIYETEAVGGPKRQGDYLNLVLEVDIDVRPKEFLVLLKNIEEKVGRKERKERWAEREIDLDIVCCGDLVFKEDDIEIPHSQMHKRFFVLKPLSELAPNWQHPIIKKSIEEMLSEIKEPAVWRKEERYV